MSNNIYTWPCGCERSYTSDSMAAAEYREVDKTLSSDYKLGYRTLYIHFMCGSYWYKQLKEVKQNEF